MQTRSGLGTVAKCHGVIAVQHVTREPLFLAHSVIRISSMLR
jgi:hypothetical protein